MIAVDTNVLVRALVDDVKEPRQCAAARSRLKKEKEVFVPQVVQVETVWVLETAHGLRRDETVAVLDHLSANAAFRLQNRDQFEAALEQYRHGSADFADYLILAESRALGSELLTFDKRLLKSAGTVSP